MTVSRCSGFLVVLLAGSFICQAAAAQMQEGLLHGVKRLSLFVLPLDNDSAACGIVESRIRQAVTEASEQAPLSLDGKEYVLFVRTSSLPREDECFSSIDLGVYWQGKVTLPEFPDGNGARVRLWENGTIVISTRKRHWDEVEIILKRLFRGMVSAWRADNDGAG